MIKKTYRYDPESGEMIETTPESGAVRSAVSTGALWNDRHYHGLQATDGTDISSRKKHRDYMKRMGVTTADDFKSSWDRAKVERENYMRHGGSVRKSDIVEAIKKLERR